MMCGCLADCGSSRLFGRELRLNFRTAEDDWIRMEAEHVRKEYVDMELEGRVVAVTGAARGIGRAIAKRLAGEGASAVLLDRDRELAAEVADEIGNARAWECDVSRREQIAAVFQ